MNSTYPVETINYTPFLAIACLLLLVMLCVILFLLINKNEEFSSLSIAYNKILQSFNELDEQAKLIVKTDLELNKAQEELDRRLIGLDSLQKLARRMNMSLDETEIFQKVDAKFIKEMGFSRSLAITFNEDNIFSPRIAIDIDENKIQLILNNLTTEDAFFSQLSSGSTLSSLNSTQKMKTALSRLFDMEHFIIAPLFVQQKLTGFLFVGNRYNAQHVTEGDEELIGILANQLAQSIENAQLFEQVFRSSQTLETKVNDRTRELTQALKKVQEVSQKKSEFISAVSHELRTPLTSIKGYAAILMTGKIGAIPDAVKERLAKINSHSDNLVKLINDLLDIARIESGRVEMRKKYQPVAKLIENTVDLLTPQLSTKKIKIQTNVTENLPEIEIDTNQVERVFINLISNAIKFTPEQGTITLNISARPQKGDILCEVADTGIGIPKEDLPKLFDEFYRVENQINLSVKGTGLGLALVKNIIKAHFGKIWVTSEEGRGTTFHFTIPIHPPQPLTSPDEERT